jgi:phosphatidylinositol alpha-1,6-mannosyltransferase
MADAFILPSSGEGLGLVLLEAQACGVPTIASSLDGGAEAVAGMGWAVDPNDAKAVEQALGEAWAAPRIRPKGLDHFSIDAFAARMNAAVDRLFAVTAK